jgi:hypothetical protein
MERNEMETLSMPEIFRGTEASVSDTETGDGNAGFIEAGQTLFHGGQNSDAIGQDGFGQWIKNTKITGRLKIQDVLIRFEIVDTVDDHRRNDDLGNK